MVETIHTWEIGYGILENIPDSKIHGANMGPTWGRQDPGGAHVGHVNLAIWDVDVLHFLCYLLIVK